eukprot:13512799-Heterocapsa_arctica.AAC.1
MEVPQTANPNWMGAFRDRHAAQASARPQPKQQIRKRQSEEGTAKEGPAGVGAGKSSKVQRNAKEQEPQPTPSQIAERRRASDKEGFSQVFRKRPREAQEADTGGTQLQGGTKALPDLRRLQVEPEREA